jgi:hypothetical protein
MGTTESSNTTFNKKKMYVQYTNLICGRMHTKMYSMNMSTFKEDNICMKDKQQHILVALFFFYLGHMEYALIADKYFWSN